MRRGRACSEKVRFGSRLAAVAALAALMRTPRRPCTVIPCQHYEGWHLTSKRKTVRRGEFNGGLLALLTLPGHDVGIKETMT
jgi:hypothetical protein